MRSTAASARRELTGPAVCIRHNTPYGPPQQETRSASRSIPHLDTCLVLTWKHVPLHSARTSTFGTFSFASLCFFCFFHCFFFCSTPLIAVLRAARNNNNDDDDKMSAQVPLPLWSQDLQFSTLTEQWLTQRTGTEIRFIASACGFKVTLGVPELRIKLRQLATGSLAQQSLTVAAVKKSADNAESADRNNQDQPSQHASGGSISKQASIHALQDVTGSEAWMRPADVDDEVFEAPMETSTAANKTPLHTEGQMRRSGATGGARISSVCESRRQDAKVLLISC